MSSVREKTLFIGLRVAALVEDGIYVPATVEALQLLKSSVEDDIYIVRFDDNSTAQCSVKNMIGTNLKPFSDFCNQPFQKVYTTHNGREVSGFVQRYQGDHILISIPGASNEKEIISKKLDEIRVFDSRQSQRFQQSNLPTELNPENDDPNAGRTVSDSIEVPYSSRRFRRTSEEPTMNELMAAMVLSSLSCSPVFHHPKGSPRSYDSSGVESWTHDSKHTSPSRTSSSRNTPAHMPTTESDLKEKDSPDIKRSRTPEDVLDSGSEMILLQRSTPTPTKQPLEKMEEDLAKQPLQKGVKMEEEPCDEPQDLSLPKVYVEETLSRPRSRSATINPSFSDVKKLDVVMEQEEQQKSDPKVAITMAMPVSIQPQIPLSYYVAPNFFQPPFYGSLPAEFRVHLPAVRSAEVGSSAPGHIDSKMHRYAHRTAPYQKAGDDSAVGSPATSSNYGSPPTSYFHLSTTPIPVSNLSFSPSHHRKQTRSPLASKPQTFHHPTSAQVTRTTPISVPSNPVGYQILPGLPFATDRNATNMKAASWHASAAQTHQLAGKPVLQPRQPSQSTSTKKSSFSSTKAPPIPFGRKVRGDGKKCRKVYGMDHRDMWCTACRWKKACQRFPD